MTALPTLLEVLPHRPPMILLDHLEEVAEDSVACSVTIRPDSPFVDDGAVPGVVATEYMAQCVAAFAGCNALRRGEAVRIGYLIGATRIDLTRDRFEVGEELRVSARRIWGDDSLGKFECGVAHNGRQVAHGILSVFQGELDDEPEAGR